MQSVLVMYCMCKVSVSSNWFICKMSLLSTGICVSCPYYVLLYMQTKRQARTFSFQKASRWRFINRVRLFLSEQQQTFLG